MCQGTDSSSTGNRSIDSALGSVVPQRSHSARMRDKVVLFVTNREVDFTAEQSARAEGRVLAYEDVFKNRLGMLCLMDLQRSAVQLIEKKVSYGQSSTNENSLFDFSVVDHSIVSSPANCWKEVSRIVASHRCSKYVIPIAIHRCSMFTVLTTASAMPRKQRPSNALSPGGIPLWD